MNLQLNSGLCLLGRLKNLRTLRIFTDAARPVTADCEEWDLNWMIASGRSSAYSRRKRLQTVEGWQKWRLNENRVEATQPRPCGVELEHRHGSASMADMAILVQLQNLGLLKDVEEEVKDMDMKMEFIPVPVLCRLSFTLPILFSPEVVLEQLFPSLIETMFHR